VADRLPSEVLARRAQLPKKPAAVVLTGSLVELRPLDLAADIDELHTISNDEHAENVWRYMSGGPFANAADLRTWLAGQDAADDGRPFTVWMRGRRVGVANLIANQPAHLKIELGSIWYGASAQRTGASREATHLLLAHVFGLGYRRAEWKCDALNEPSRRAALSYGFTFEGIQDAHYIIKDRNRDTAWFRMLDHEWRARTGAR
jgi:RimJ/RimL family protein N-acetyltransferase